MQVQRTARASALTVLPCAPPQTGTDREDCRRFGAVKRFCHNEKCANYGILQLVRPNGFLPSRLLSEQCRGSAPPPARVRPAALCTPPSAAARPHR